MSNKTPNYTDEQIYATKFMMNAEGFLFAANACKSKTSEATGQALATGEKSIDLGFIVPAAANYAFCCELFFKAIICMETSKEIRGHPLIKLFEHMTPSTQDIFIQVTKKTSAQVTQILKDNSLMFMKARYFEIETLNPKDLQLMAESARVTANVLLKTKLENGAYVDDN